MAKNVVEAERLHQILENLEQGMPREELAKKLGHSDYRSLDMYMRRRGYTWSSELQNYILKKNKIDSGKIKKANVHFGKVSQVIELFEQGHDAKTVAKKLLFSNHRSLAEYMKQKGYEWDNERRNYEPVLGVQTKEGNFSTDINNEGNMTGIVEQIPRYMIPGIIQAKNISLSHLLNQLVIDFAHERNITQRELFETAAIEFLIKYGYVHEVKALFRK